MILALIALLFVLLPLYILHYITTLYILYEKFSRVPRSRLLTGEISVHGTGGNFVVAGQKIAGDCVPSANFNVRSIGSKHELGILHGNTSVKSNLFSAKPGLP